MEHVAWRHTPALRTPTLIAAFTGWNDAGDAASLAVRHLVEQLGAEPFASIDPEPFYDFQASRPLVRLVDGATREIVWPANDFFWAHAPGGDVVLLLGAEPQLRWRTFCEQITSVSSTLGVPLVITLGALLADVVHRHPVGLIGTASDQETIERHGLQRSRYEGPTGITGVLHDACARTGLSSVSLWATVPAYAPQITSPKAAVALASGACDIVGTPFVAGPLAVAAVEYERHIERLVAADDDLATYVRRLEAGEDLDDDEDDDDGATGDAVDAEMGSGPRSSNELRDASADELVEDIERFLRDQGGSER
jgi:predicted ATP-grasp superfamily ATP-dependent carboligase